nr:late embryogenesis abundant protein 1-like [Coffea arabica]
MSSTQFNAGETHGRTQAKTEQLVDSCKDAANAARDRSAQAADQSAGFLQQTGEQVKSMAQGAIDGVKNTLGVGDNNTKK